MIGQEYSRNFLYGLINKHCLPRFLLLVGDKGSGKRTLADDIVRYLDGRQKEEFNSSCGSYIVPDVKIATIRTIIDDAYKHKTRFVYIIPDIDDMSKEAQNSILKVTEEPPNKAYFIMTVTDINNVLPTIKSRAFTVFMDKYKQSEIDEYIDTKYPDIIIPAGICETPGEVENYVDNGGAKFYEFVEKVVDNVDSVTTANALKILDSLNLKGEKGYDVTLFLKVFIRHCTIKALHSIEDYREAGHYINMIRPTSEALAELRVRTANKTMVMSTWIFNIRS